MAATVALHTVQHVQRMCPHYDTLCSNGVKVTCESVHKVEGAVPHRQQMVSH